MRHSIRALLALTLLAAGGCKDEAPPPVAPPSKTPARKESAPKPSCLKKRDCTVHGRCTAVGDQCKTTSDVDCRKSSGCSSGGKCTHKRGACVLPQAPEANARQVPLRVPGEGLSSDSEYSDSEPSRADSDSDCRQLGRCHAHGAVLRHRRLRRRPAARRGGRRLRGPLEPAVTRPDEVAVVPFSCRAARGLQRRPDASPGRPPPTATRSGPWIVGGGFPCENGTVSPTAVQIAA